MIDLQNLYETIREVPVTLLTHWDSAHRGSYSAVLPKHCRLRVSENYAHGDQFLQCFVVEDEDYEAASIPSADRSHPEYQGFSVSLKLTDLTSNCVPVTDS